MDSVYVEPGTEASVELRLDQPAGAPSDKYHFVALASGEELKSELSLDLIIREKLLPSMSFSTDLPDIQCSPTGFDGNGAGVSLLTHP